MKQSFGSTVFPLLFTSAMLVSACGTAQADDVSGGQVVGKGLEPLVVEPSYGMPERRVLDESLPYDLLVQLYVLPNGALETCFISKSPIAANLGNFETERTQGIGGFDFCVQNGVTSKGWAWYANAEGAPQTTGEVNVDSSETRVAVYFQAPFMVEVYQVLGDGTTIPMDVDGITGLNEQGVLDVLNTPFEFLHI